MNQDKNSVAAIIEFLTGLNKLGNDIKNLSESIAISVDNFRQHLTAIGKIFEGMPTITENVRDEICKKATVALDNYTKSLSVAISQSLNDVKTAEIRKAEAEAIKWREIITGVVKQEMKQDVRPTDPLYKDTKIGFQRSEDKE
jgi:hypothetical protein